MTDNELTPEERENLDTLRNRPGPFPEPREQWEAFEAGWKAAGEARNVIKPDSRDNRLRAFARWKETRDA